MRRRSKLSSGAVLVLARFVAVPFLDGDVHGGSYELFYRIEELSNVVSSSDPSSAIGTPRVLGHHGILAAVPVDRRTSESMDFAIYPARSPPQALKCLAEVPTVIAFACFEGRPRFGRGSVAEGVTLAE